MIGRGKREPEDRRKRVLRAGSLQVLWALLIAYFLLAGIAILFGRQVGFGIAFGVFAGKGLFLSVALLDGWQDLAQLLVISAAFDLLILALFYGFTLRR